VVLSFEVRDIVYATDKGVVSSCPDYVLDFVRVDTLYDRNIISRTGSDINQNAIKVVPGVFLNG